MPNKIKVGINGFGRIGRSLFRLLLNNENIEVAVINDLGDAKTFAHLVKYDSIHGTLNGEVKSDGENIVVDGKYFPLTHQPDINTISWKPYPVDVVVESTGLFKTRKELQKHIDGGAPKVILSVPPKDNSIKMVVLGVNENTLEDSDDIISNASCTTNNVAPMVKVIQDTLGINQAYISTVHSYTSNQNLHDHPHADLRRARAAGRSIIPTTTGATDAVRKIFPEIANVIDGWGIRVPVPNGSLTDMTLNVKRDTTPEEVNEIFKKASEKGFKGIIQYMEDPIVSSDVIGNPYSCVFDEEMTKVIDKRMVKLIGWYDNERGYSNRLVDLIALVTRNTEGK